MAFTEDDSFCTQAQVESRVQRGTFSGTTVPTDQEVLDYMAFRASQIQTMMWNAGYPVTVDSMSNPIVTGGSDEGKTVERLAQLANMFLAAGDVIYALDARDTETAPQLAVGFWREGTRVVQQLEKFILGNLVTAQDRSATKTGGIGKGDFAPTGEDEELKRDDRKESFNMSQVW